MRMRAMGRKSFMGRDSDFEARLFRSLEKNKQQFYKMTTLRDNVFIIYTNRNKYLLKGFDNPEKLNAQKLLTKKLKEEGFSQTYEFVDHLSDFRSNGVTYSWIEYLKPNREKFSFSKRYWREEGLNLLENYHKATSSFKEEIQVDYFNQLKKWEDRFNKFHRNTHKVNRLVSNKHIDMWLKWGDYALNGVRKYEQQLYEEPLVITHGDVAHHNFFHKKDGSLFLIDFDLISKAPPIMDYLQYANRIMPNLENSEELWTYQQINQYKNNKAFLYALVFPTDIFREWNRIIKESATDDTSYLYSVQRLTIKERKHRMAMYNEIIDLLKK